MPTKLLNDDGTASMATAMISSHHAFRRDAACFAQALREIASGDTARSAAVVEEWKRFREGLHHHHTIEDTSIFPGLRAARPDLAGGIDQLDVQHAAIDPVLEAGDRAFADLASPAAASAVIADLERLLAEHLDLEEQLVIPTMRDAKQFPLPPDEASQAMYADGFAWSTAGLAPSVIAEICKILPSQVADRLPAARRAFDARCVTVWGHAHTGASQTSAPDR